MFLSSPQPRHATAIPGSELAAEDHAEDDLTDFPGWEEDMESEEEESDPIVEPDTVEQDWPIFRFNIQSEINKFYRSQGNKL